MPSVMANMLQGQKSAQKHREKSFWLKLRLGPFNLLVVAFPGSYAAQRAEDGKGKRQGFKKRSCCRKTRRKHARYTKSNPVDKVQPAYKRVGKVYQVDNQAQGTHPHGQKRIRLGQKNTHTQRYCCMQGQNKDATPRPKDHSPAMVPVNGAKEHLCDEGLLQARAPHPIGVCGEYLAHCGCMYMSETRGSETLRKATP